MSFTGSHILKDSPDHLFNLRNAWSKIHSGMGGAKAEIENLDLQWFQPSSFPHKLTRATTPKKKSNPATNEEMDSASADDKKAIRHLLQMGEQHADWTCVMDIPSDEQVVQRLVEMRKRHAELTRLKEFPNEGVEQLLLKPRSNLFHYLFLVERFLEMHGHRSLPSDEHHIKIMYEIAADCAGWLVREA